MQTHNPHLKEISDESQKKAIIHEVPPNKVNEGFFVDNEHQEAQPPFIINNQLPQDKNPALQLPVFSDNQSSPNYQGKEEPPIVASISSESNNIMKNTDKPQNFEPTQTTSKISEQPNFSSKSPSIIPQIRPQKPALTKINTPKGNSNSFRNQTKVFTCSNDASPKRKVEESSPTTIIKRRKVEPSPILKSPSSMFICLEFHLLSNSVMLFF